MVDFAPGSDAEKDFEALVSWLEEVHKPQAPLVELANSQGSRAAELAKRVKAQSEASHNPSVIGRINPIEEFDDTKF